MTMNRFILWIACLATVSLGCIAPAQEVFQSARQRTGWVGRPLIVQYIFADVADAQPPTMPHVDGLQYQVQPPQSSSNTVISFGQRTTKSETAYPVAIIANRPGSFTIPSFELNASGQQFRTEPLTLQFLPSSDDALLQTSVTSTSQHAWLGDIVPAQLEIRIRPFQHTALPSGRLSAVDTWRLVDRGTNAWGPFADTIEHLRQQRNMPPVRTIRDANGELAWYVFDVPSTLRPDRTGPVNVGDVYISLDYPMDIGRSRNPLDEFMGRGGLRITQSRPVTARPEALNIDVQSPPETGRPAGWTGAVGAFEFNVTATPSTVDVGEPLTLRMTVRDVSDRPADLHTLAAPALHDVDALTEDFKVPQDRPGGIVSGRTKTFTQSIRPMRDDIDVIPPVPFSFFNPDKGTYQTVFGPPIPLTVRFGHTLTADDLAGMPVADQSNAANLTSVHGGLLANITDPDQLLRAPHEPALGWLLAVLIVPPLVFAGAASSRRMTQRAIANPDRGRARRAHRNAASHLESVGANPDGVAEAVRMLVIDRLSLRQGMMRDDLTIALRQRDAETANAFNTCMQALEAMTFGGAHASIDATMRARVEQLMTDITEVTR